MSKKKNVTFTCQEKIFPLYADSLPSDIAEIRDLWIDYKHKLIKGGGGKWLPSRRACRSTTRRF